MTRMTTYLLFTMLLLPSSVFADQMIGQLNGHSEALRLSPTPANIDRALRYMRSPQVQLSLNSNLSAIDRAVTVLMDQKTPNQTRRETRENLKRAANRLNAYNSLFDTLRNRAGETRMQGIRPLSLNATQAEVLRATRAANANALREYLRRRAERLRGGRTAAPRPPSRDIPEVLNPGGGSSQ